MAFQSNQLTTPDGKQVLAPASGVAKRTTTALAIGASWDTGIVYYNGNRNIQISFASDQNGAFKVEYFDSNGVLLPFMGNTTSYNAVDGVFQAGIAAKGDAVKITYTNNGTAQTSFFFELALLNTPIQETLRSVSTPMSATNLASTTHAVVEGREAATGSYKQATVSQVGDKVALDVNVINRSNETQKVEVTNPTPVSFPSNQNVTVSNFPATQPVSGTVNANVTFPTTQNVAGSVSISNLPATQPISAATLPLPAGAATGAKQDTGNASLASIDSKLTSPIAVTLSGGATAANQTALNTAIGSISDPIVTDATQAASLISLTKGLLQESLAQPTTGSAQTINLAANVAQTIAGNSNGKGRLIFSTSGTILIGFGFTATATLYSVRLVTNGFYEVPPLWSNLSISLFSTASSTVNVTTLA